MRIRPPDEGGYGRNGETSSTRLSGAPIPDHDTVALADEITASARVVSGRRALSLPVHMASLTRSRLASRSRHGPARECLLRR